MDYMYVPVFLVLVRFLLWNNLKLTQTSINHFECKRMHITLAKKSCKNSLEPFQVFFSSQQFVMKAP